MTDKFEELRKKGDDMLQQLKKEIAELFKLSKADFRQVYTTAFRSLTKQNKQYENQNNNNTNSFYLFNIKKYYTSYIEC